MTIRRIAVEEAFVTPEIMTEWYRVLGGRNVEPGFAKMGETILARTPANKPMDDRLLDIGAGRIAHMDQVGIDMQILSLTSPGVQVFESSLATRLAAASNDALAEAVRAHPTRFAGLAAIAPQDPASAAREIERAAKLKLNGLIVNSHTMGEYLDAEKFWPILEAAQDLDASTVDPYFDALRGLVTEELAAHQAAAQQADLLSRVGTLAALLWGAVAVGLLFIRAQRAIAGTARLEGEQLGLQAREADLREALAAAHRANQATRMGIM